MSLIRAIIRTMTDNCPNIRTLAFFPDLDADKNWGITSSIEALSYALPSAVLEPYPKHTETPCLSATNLRSLKTTTALLASKQLGPGFSPNLKSLDVYHSNYDSHLISKLPLHLFPGLDHLGLYRFPFWSAADLGWERISAMFGGLTSLAIDIGFISSAAADNSFMLDATRLLSQFSPCLLDLTFCCTSSREDISAADLRPLAKLPLQHLRLYSMTIRDGEDECGLCQVGAILPHLKTLQVPQALVNMSHLWDIASKMPELECLALMLDLADVPARATFQPGLNSLHLLQFDLFGDFSEIKYEEVRRLAEYVTGLYWHRLLDTHCDV